MNRIDTAQAPYQLRRALAEFTGKEVSTLTLGRVKPIEGVEGGLQRQMTARLGGERKSFTAMEVGGKVTIIDGSLGLETNKAHEFLKRVDAAREKRLTSAQVSSPNSSHQATTGWPVRQASTANHVTATRAQVRRR